MIEAIAKTREQFPRAHLRKRRLKLLICGVGGAKFEISA